MSNEYGIFQTIVEGDQAEAYKKKKADEKTASDNKYAMRAMRFGMDRDQKDPDYESKVDKVAKKSPSFHSKVKDGVKNVDDAVAGVRAADAYERHQRRHGNNESTINFI